MFVGLRGFGHLQNSVGGSWENPFISFLKHSPTSFQSSRILSSADLKQMLFNSAAAFLPEKSKILSIPVRNGDVGLGFLKASAIAFMDCCKSRRYAKSSYWENPIGR